MRPEYARRYRELWDGHWWWRSREAHVLARIGRLRGRSDPAHFRILDIGCGDGLFFDKLGRHGRVEGLEPDASLVDDPRWRSQIRVGGLGPGCRFEANYDLVLMLDVLEHIQDDRAALASAVGAIGSGGHLLVTVPALPWLWSRHDEANAHFRRYRPGPLRDLLAGAGLRVESIRFFFAWTVAPLLARRLLAPAGSSSGLADYEVAIPPAPINRALDLLSRADHAIGRAVRWPLGSSLLAIARKPLR